jgi:DNA polymerase III delta prime subunit
MTRIPKGTDVMSSEVALKRKRHLLLTGHPGVGKTTILIRLAFLLICVLAASTLKRSGGKEFGSDSGSWGSTEARGSFPV